jgi:hypothetical protein
VLGQKKLQLKKANSEQIKTFNIIIEFWILNFYFLAPPSFEIKKRTQTALISENTVLQCEAKGEKPIGVLWNKDNKRLDANVDPR